MLVIAERSLTLTYKLYVLEAICVYFNTFQPSDACNAFENLSIKLYLHFINFFTVNYNLLFII